MKLSEVVAQAVEKVLAELESRGLLRQPEDPEVEIEPEPVVEGSPEPASLPSPVRGDPQRITAEELDRRAANRSRRRPASSAWGPGPGANW